MWLGFGRVWAGALPDIAHDQIIKGQAGRSLALPTAKTV